MTNSHTQHRLPQPGQQTWGPPPPQRGGNGWQWALCGVGGTVFVLFLAVMVIGAAKSGSVPTSEYTVAVTTAAEPSPALLAAPVVPVAAPAPVAPAPVAPAAAPVAAVVPAVRAATPAPARAPAPSTPSVGDGTYQVGVDIPAGRYKTPGPDKTDLIPHCFYERTKDDSGEFGSIIANNISDGPSSVTVNKGEFVRLDGGCTWTKQ